MKTYLNQDNLQARYPSYDTLVTEMRQGGVDAVFTTLYEGRKAFYASRIIAERDPAIDMARFRESAKKQNVKFGAICQIFYDADTLAERPDLVPIDQHGSGEFVNWQRLVCPTDPGYRQYKLSIVKEIAATIHPDVVSLDFMRFPTTWEIIPADAKPESIRNYCFCDRCMRAFQETTKVVVPPALTTIPKRAAWILANHNPEWVKWKTGVITSFVEEAARDVRAIDPAIEVSVHVVPWAESVFDNALVWNAAQDVTALSRHVDYLSPMIYHKLIGQPTDYIRTLTAELATQNAPQDSAEHSDGGDRQGRTTVGRRVQAVARQRAGRAIGRDADLPLGRTAARRAGAGASAREERDLQESSLSTGMTGQSIR